MSWRFCLLIAGSFLLGIAVGGVGVAKHEDTTQKRFAQRMTCESLAAKYDDKPFQLMNVGFSPSRDSCIAVVELYGGTRENLFVRDLLTGQFLYQSDLCDMVDKACIKKAMDGQEKAFKAATR